jgi:hypothetical protein
LSDAAQTVPFVIVSRMRRTSSVPLLTFQALSVFVTFAGPSLIPVRSVVAAMVGAVAILTIRQAFRVGAPPWPKGPAMDAFSAALGAVLFSMLCQIGTHHYMGTVSTLDCGTGAFLLMFSASTLWAPEVVGRPPLGRRMVYLTACAAWATVMAFPASALSDFATGAMIANRIADGSLSAEHAWFAEAMVNVVTLAPITGVIGAMFLGVIRPCLAFGALQKAGSSR